MLPLIQLNRVTKTLKIMSNQAVGKIIIPGGSGFLGVSLAGYLTGLGYEVIILSRNNKEGLNGIRYIEWDGESMGNWAKEFENAVAIINLAGKSVDCRYTEKNKAAILSSRLNSTKIIGEAIKQCTHPPKVWMNASSATIYVDSREQFMDEETGIIGNDFSMNVCKSWEKVFYDSLTPTPVRKIALRTSIVLGKHGGAFIPLLNLAKVGLGGKQGDGGQFFSWLHIDDFNRSIHWLLTNDLEGNVNIVGPKPIENEAVMSLLRKAVNRNYGLNLSNWMLKIGAFFRGTETELILKSRKVIPQRLLKAGFKFKFDTLESACTDLVNR